MEKKYKITNLNETEFRSLCKIIGEAKLKSYYESNINILGNSKNSGKESVTVDTVSISTIVSNRKNQHIINWCNEYVNTEFEKIQSLVLGYESQGDDNHIALAKAIKESPFRENPEIYFKLAGITSTSTFALAVKKAIYLDSSTYSHNKKSKNTDNQTKMQKETMKSNYENEERIKQQEECHRLKGEIEKSKSLISELELKCKKYEEELISLNQGNGRFSAIGINLLDNQHLSFCEISDPDFNGRIWLMRLADINEKGDIIKFTPNPDAPFFFNNRKSIYFRHNEDKGVNEPDKSGQCGVWVWSSTPSPEDQAKDLNDTFFHPEISPIQVILLEKCRNLPELIQAISSGIEEAINCSRFIISLRQDDGYFNGFLIDKQQVTQISNIIKLKDDIIILPQYLFPARDIVALSNNKLYYNRINISISPSQTIIKNPGEIVKQVILARSSWSLVKERGEHTKTDWKIIKNYIETLDTSSVIEDIQSKTGCSDSEARKMLDNFITNAYKYADGICVEDQWLLALLSVDNDLLFRCQELIRASWCKENEALLKEAEDRLSSVKNDIAKEEKKQTDLIKKSEDRLKETNAAYEEARIKLDKITSDIHDAEVLASQVEEKVSDRIRAARTDAASFIAEMAFHFPGGDSQAQSATIPNGDIATYHSGVFAAPEMVDECNSWNDTLSVLSDCLKDAGVSNAYCTLFAGYLYALYTCHCPLLLAGPNSLEIADALSYALTGRTAGSMICLGPYDANIVLDSVQSEDIIVKIINPFSAEWITRLPEVLTNRSKFYIAVYPYTEDLQIEPKSLYNYFLPVLTELFVDRPADTLSYAGKKSQTYKEFETKDLKPSKSFNKSGLKASPYVTGRIQSIIAMANQMQKSSNCDIDVLFALFPYAFVTMQTTSLLECIGTDESSKLPVSKALFDLIQSQYGETI